MAQMAHDLLARRREPLFGKRRRALVWRMGQAQTMSPPDSGAASVPLLRQRAIYALHKPVQPLQLGIRQRRAGGHLDRAALILDRARERIELAGNDIVALLRERL